MLTGMNIDIMTETEDSERRQEEFRTRSGLFMEALDVDDVIAHLLIAEGFATVEEVAFVPVDELAKIEGFDPDVASELQQRAASYLETEAKRLDGERKELGVADAIADIEGLTPAAMVALGKANVKSVEDLADLASDELQEALKDVAKMTETDANAVIMRARVAAGWFTEAELRQAEAEAAARKAAKADATNNLS